MQIRESGMGFSIFECISRKLNVRTDFGVVCSRTVATFGLNRDLFGFVVVTGLTFLTFQLEELVLGFGKV